MLDDRQRALADRIFEQAVALPPEQRTDLLARACPDPQVRDEIQSLLRFSSRPLHTLEDAVRVYAKDVVRRELAPSSALGRYRIERVTGVGGFGAVYEAFDTVRGEPVALKTLHAMDPAAGARLKREFRVLAGISHPNLVELYELAFDGSAPYFTMELIRGCDFRAHLESTARLPGGETRFLRCAAQLVTGIQALHDCG